MERDIRCHVVIQTALSWGPEILVPVPIREGYGSGGKRGKDRLTQDEDGLKDLRIFQNDYIPPNV